MFFGYFSLKIMAFLGAMLLVGFALLPTDVTFFLVGALSLVISLFTLDSSGPASVWLAAIGAGMVVVGLLVQRHTAKEEKRHAEELSNNLRRIGGASLPWDPDE